MQETTEKPIIKPEPLIQRWINKLKNLAILAGTWAVLFSVITIIGFKIGFEYDDGLVFSTPAFNQAAGRCDIKGESPSNSQVIKNAISPDKKDYWNFLNRSYKLERTKLIPLLTAGVFKTFGFDIYVICMREDIGTDSIKYSWKPFINEFIFVENDLKKYKVLEKENFLLYFANSDADIIQSKKANTTVIRLKRSSKSVNKTLYTPGKFNEFILPLSEF
jgi:acid phosphatase class B